MFFKYFTGSLEGSGTGLTLQLEDDSVTRKASVNPSALHTSESYQCFDVTSSLPKVLVLFCGGTLIMRENKDGSLVVNDKEVAIDMLLNLEPRLKEEVASISVEYVDNIDSSNMSPRQWHSIGTIIKESYDKYDGFVITHGTDTMAYTASALSFILQDIGKPVVLTGAQIPAGRIASDA